MLSILGLVGNWVHTSYKMLAVLSISMWRLFMQELFPYICMLVRFKMIEPESFRTIFFEGQPGQYHGTLAHMLPVNHSYASQMPFLKLLTIFFAKGSACVSEEQLPANGLLSSRSRGLISERFVGLEGQDFPQVTYFQLHWTILTFWTFFTSNQSPFARLGESRSNPRVVSYKEAPTQCQNACPLIHFLLVSPHKNNPLIWHPRKVLLLSHTLSPHNVYPF